MYLLHSPVTLVCFGSKFWMRLWLTIFSMLRMVFNKAQRTSGCIDSFAHFHNKYGTMKPCRPPEKFTWTLTGQGPLIWGVGKANFWLCLYPIRFFTDLFILWSYHHGCKFDFVSFLIYYRDCKEVCSAVCMWRGGWCVSKTTRTEGSWHGYIKPGGSATVVEVAYYAMTSPGIPKVLTAVKYKGHYHGEWPQYLETQPGDVAWLPTMWW